MIKHLALIPLIRGINVGGHRPLKMEALQEMFEAMNFENVSTYIQSGNVLFDAPASQTTILAGNIRQQIHDTFDYEVAVMVRTIPEVEAILRQDPFAEHEKEGRWECYISFLPEEPLQRKIQNLIALKSEAEVFGANNREVYALVDKESPQKPLFSNSFIEKQLDMPATTRNRRTIHKIVESLS